jgi:hypothetical protein
MRAPLEATEVERSLILPKGWAELGLGFDYKNATGEWGSDGSAIDWSDASWTYTTERFDVRYGISPRAELWMTVPLHYVNLSNASLGTDITGFGLGEPRFGWRLEWLRTHAPTTSIITDLWMKVPSGLESPGTYVGGPKNWQHIPMSSGTQDLGLDIRAKRQFGPVSITGDVGFIYRMSGVTQFLVETENEQFAGRFKPGSEFHAELDPLIQLGPIAVEGNAIYRRRFASALGTTSGGSNWDANLQTIGGSDGWSFDVGGQLIANITRGFDLRAGAMVPLRGEDLTFFPLEELTPTRGMTFSGTVELRY